MDLLALDELMATLRDWLATCQAMVPRVCWWGGGGQLGLCRVGVTRNRERRTPRPGVNMPAVTTKLDSTKQDILKGRKTGSPVSRERERRGFSLCTARVRSVTLQPASSLTGMQRRVDNLLGLPQLRCHLVRLALLVGYQRPLGLLETRLAHEQRASTPREILVSSCFLVSVPDLPALSSRPRVARLPIVTPCLSCLSADAMPATRRARRYRRGPLGRPPPGEPLTSDL